MGREGGIRGADIDGLLHTGRGVHDLRERGHRARRDL